ncbi:hypothetical protein M1843_06740 [Isoptericola sp. 4D.3]|uniref:NAD(P)-binding domain-containing protein n=1 Tax=Isoptericola peretonis TaxID=2918523 RepID=A0ABT0J1R0_9MICO|nr:hypothetical protein [Isoptericola sp. 4D.3]
MKIAVAGATGTVGTHVVDTAQARGHLVVPLSRTTGVDLLTGRGISNALDGVDALVDVTNQTTLSASRARRFFQTVTRTQLAAETSAGVGHHVVLSIVGIDDIDASYDAGKLAQERMVASGPVAVMPRVLMRPVAAREVAVHLVDRVEAATTFEEWLHGPDHPATVQR